LAAAGSADRIPLQLIQPSRKRRRALRIAAEKLGRLFEVFWPVQIEIKRQQPITCPFLLERAKSHPENLRGTPGNPLKHLGDYSPYAGQVVAAVCGGAKNHISGLEQPKCLDDSPATHPRCVGAHDDDLAVTLLPERIKRFVQPFPEVSSALDVHPPSLV
jgi:hypothetical protein